MTIATEGSATLRGIIGTVLNFLILPYLVVLDLMSGDGYSGNPTGSVIEIVQFYISVLGYFVTYIIIGLILDIIFRRRIINS